MLASVTGVLQHLFFGVCAMSLRATVLLAVFLLAGWLFGAWLTARWRYALWGVLLLAMLLPRGIAVPVLPGGIAEWGVTPSTRDGGAVLYDAPSAPLAPFPSPATVETARPALSSMGPRTPSAVGGAFWPAIIWVSGVVALLLRLLVTSARLKARVLGESRIASHAVHELFEETRRAMAPRSWPVLIVTRHVSSPALLGAIRPKILLPEDLANKASQSELRNVFRHELAHLKRGDIWANWLWSMALVLHWFNPLLWLAGSRIARDRELACDETVLDGLFASAQRIEYGQTLLAFTRYTAPLRRRAGWAGILESQPILRRRIDMIANYRPRALRHRLVGLLFLFGLGAFAVMTPAQEPAQPLSAQDAELMGRVEHFFLNNFRDITARKSLEWGKAEVGEDGNRSIRYQYLATIWDKEKQVMNQRFTFDEKGSFVKVEPIEGFPKAFEEEKADLSTEKGMKERVELFFSRNYRDISARKTLAWGKPFTDEDGNRCIRYKYEATIRDKDVIVQNKVFTFTPDGEYVSAKDAAESAASGEPKE